TPAGRWESSSTQADEATRRIRRWPTPSHCTSARVRPCWRRLRAPRSAPPAARPRGPADRAAHEILEEAMPYPNCSPKLTVTNGGRTVTLTGPLEPPDDDLESTHLFAIVAQAPESGEPNGSPEDPSSATARGDEKFYPEAQSW